MKMKPKSTVHNPKALVYRRFIGLEKSINLQTVYFTVIESKYWTFDVVNLQFDELESSLVPTSSSIVEIPIATTDGVHYNMVVLSYQNKYFTYLSRKWQQVEELLNGITLLSAKFGNIGKYQTNKYYYVGSFDYMVKGSIEGTTSQYIKGNIIPLTSMNIKYFNDEINLNVDDLVVIGKKLFSVENPETTMKMQPKPLKIYFATLNAIL